MKYLPPSPTGHDPLQTGMELLTGELGKEPLQLSPLNLHNGRKVKLHAALRDLYEGTDVLLRLQDRPDHTVQPKLLVFSINAREAERVDRPLEHTFHFAPGRKLVRFHLSVECHRDLDLPAAVAMDVMLVANAMLVQTRVAGQFVISIFDDQEGVTVNGDPCLLGRFQYVADGGVFGNFDDLLLGSSCTVEVYLDEFCHFFC